MLRIDKVQLEILINGDPARLKLTELNKEASALRKEIKSTKDEFEKGIKMDKLRDVEKQMEDVRQEIGLAGMTMKELGQRANQLKTILSNLKPGTKEFQDYKKELEQVNARQKELRASGEQTNGFFDSLKVKAIAVVGAITGIIAGFTGLVSNVIQVRSEFEKYEAVLTNALGSHEKANDAMNMLSDFAAKTNFQLTELTENYVKFANRGLVLTQEQLTKMADVANATGKSFDQLSEAILDINNPERWKEMGIKAETTGSKVRLTFKGVTQEVDRTEQGVIKAMEAFGSMAGVMGQTAAISKTMDGQISNLGDSFDRFYNTLGEGKLGGAIKGVIGFFGGLVDKATEWMKIPTSEKLKNEQAEINNLVHSITSVNSNQRLRNDLIKELQEKYPSFLGNLSAEKVTNEQLLARLKDVNEEYLKRIRIAVVEEDIKKNEAEMQNIWRQERETIKNLDRDYQKLVENKKENATIEEKIQALMKVSTTMMVGQTTVAIKGKIGNDYKYTYNRLLSEENRLTAQYNDLLKERNTIKPPDEKPTTTITPTVSLTDEQAKQAAEKELQAVEERNLRLQNIEKQRYIKGETDEYEYSQRILNIENKNSLERIAVLKKYADGHIEIQKMIQDEQAKYQDRNIKRLMDEKKYRDDILKLGSSLVDAENKEYDDRLKKAGLFNKNRTKLTSEQLKALEILEAQHAEKLQEISFADWNKAFEKSNKSILETRKQTYLQDLINAGNNAEARKQIEEKYADDVNTIELGQLETKKARIAEAIADIEAKYQADDETRKQLIKKFYDDVLVIDQQVQDKKNQIIETGLQRQDELTKERENARKEYNLISLAEQEKTEIDALNAKHEKGLLSDEEYEQALANIRLKWLADTLKGYAALTDSMNNMVKGLQDAEIAKSQTKYQTELAQLEDKHDRQLISDENYNKQKSALEKKQQEEEKKIKKKYADQAFAMQVAQIIASTAMAAIQAYQAVVGIPFVGPVLAPIAAAAAVAYGATQIAQAKEQRDQVKALAKGKYDVTGAEDGQAYYEVPFIGHADTGLYTKPTLIAERGPELVVSAPHVRNLQMNYPQILSAIMATRVPQYADGSYSSASGTAPVTMNNDKLVMVLATVSSSLNTLNSKLDNLYAKVLMDEFKQIEEKYDALMTDVRKS